MKNRHLIIVLSVSLLMLFSISLKGQSYIPTPVTISKEKVRIGGLIYYSHLVLERQTLYSIAKTYGVTIKEINDANKNLDLEHNGLKKDQIILIPFKETTKKYAGEIVNDLREEPEYIIHTVKWYEDLKSIADKYNLNEELLMQFNNLQNNTVTKRQKIRIPRHPEKLHFKQIQEQNEPIHNDYKENNLLKEDVTAILMLPFDAAGNGNQSSMDFYCGALLAIKDLGESGISTDLSVYDVAGGIIPVTRERLERSDITIGPINKTDLTTVLEKSENNSMIISPLDQKAEPFAFENSNFIQAPTPSYIQYQDIANWVKEELKEGDRIVVITEKGIGRTEYEQTVFQKMKQYGIYYNTISYSILEGRNIINYLMDIATTDYTTRFVIASDNEAFVNDVVRNLNLLIHNKYNVVLYGNSKLRSFDTIDAESLHNLQTRVSSSYYIDYDNSSVKKFLMAYRALYNAEPTPFSYQGYDLAKYFISIVSRYGINWREMLESRDSSGLQSSYMFVRTEAGGYVNHAVRRIIYDADYSTHLIN